MLITGIFAAAKKYRRVSLTTCDREPMPEK
jgi:hypothetical protein